jgi:hypothetical protein
LAGTAVPLNCHPLAATIVMLEIANWLLDGLDTVKASTVSAPAVVCGKVEVTGERISAFELEAKTGVATGTRKRIPDTASSASTSPELRFLRYEYLGVFIIFELTGRNEIYKGHGQIVYLSSSDCTKGTPFRSLWKN